MKTMFLMVIAIIMMATVTLAGEPMMVYTKKSVYHIHANVVTAFDDAIADGQSIYLACGEDESNDNAFVGNAWMQDKSLRGVWDEYKLIPPVAGSNYWTLPIPEEVRVKKISKIRCGIVTADAKGRFKKWAHLEYFRTKIVLVNKSQNLSLSSADDN